MCNDFDEISRDPTEITDNFTIIPNDLLRDQSISPECIWLISYLLSHKPGWKISTNQVWEHAKHFMGRDKVRKLFNEAIEAGYMFRKKVKRQSKFGQLWNFAYVVSSQKKFKDFNNKLDKESSIQQPKIKTKKLEIERRETETQGIGFPSKKEPKSRGPENQAIRIEEQSKEYYLKKRKCVKEKKDFAVLKTAPLSLRSANANANASLHPPKNLNKNFKKKESDNKIQHGSHVKLSPEEYQTFCTQNSKAEIDLLIERMNDYCLASNPKGYKDYAAAMRNWIRKDKQTQCVPRAHAYNNALSMPTNAVNMKLTLEKISENRHATEEFCKKHWNRLACKGIRLNCLFNQVEIEKRNGEEIVSTKILKYDDVDFLNNLKDGLKEVFPNA